MPYQHDVADILGLVRLHGSLSRRRPGSEADSIERRSGRTGPLTGQERGWSRARIPVLAVVVIAASGLAAWLIAIDELRLAGAVALVGAFANGFAAAGADDGTPRAVFLEEVADRLIDGAVLATLAWLAFPADPRLTAAAVSLLVAGSITAYLRARGRGLGYTVAELPVYRTIRGGIVAVGLLVEEPEPALWLALAVVVVAGGLRWIGVAREDERLWRAGRTWSRPAADGWSE